MHATPIRTAFDRAPELLAWTEVAQGLLWLRLPLPYSLNHVNIYLLEDGDGWVLVDTGLGDEVTLALWDTLLEGPLAGFRIRRVIVTHCHPDHIGCAGMLSRRFGAPVAMTFTEYLFTHRVMMQPDFEREEYEGFYREHGLDDASTALVLTRGHEYLRKITGLPNTFLRLEAGETLEVGGRVFEVLTGGGHGLEQMMLLCREEKLFLAADQVMLKISPNVSVVAVDPQGDPLGSYLRSLAALTRTVPPDVLVLPGHFLPFTGLHHRIAELQDHHEERCELVLTACSTQERSAAELVPFVFERSLDPHQMGFAFSEVLAHANRLVREHRLEAVESGSGTTRFRPPRA